MGLFISVLSTYKKTPETALIALKLSQDKEENAQCSREYEDCLHSSVLAQACKPCIGLFKNATEVQMYLINCTVFNESVSMNELRQTVGKHHHSSKKLRLSSQKNHFPSKTLAIFFSNPSDKTVIDVFDRSLWHPFCYWTCPQHPHNHRYNHERALPLIFNLSCLPVLY